MPTDAFVTIGDETFVLKSGYLPDDFFTRATQRDLSLDALTELVEANTERTAYALVILSGGDVDPEIVLDILRTGAWPDSKNPAEEAAAFAHHLLKAMRAHGSGVTWQFSGDLYRYLIGPQWNFWLEVPDDGAANIEALARSTTNAKIECVRTGMPLQRVEVEVDATAPFETKLATYCEVRKALLAFGCVDAMSRARARAAAQEAAAKIEAPKAAARAAALVASAAVPTDWTRKLEQQCARARQAGSFEVYYDMWQQHGEQHSTDEQRAEMEADRVRMASERVESKAAVEALVTKLRAEAPGEVERWANAHIAYLRAFIEDCIGAGEGELTAASNSRQECDAWAEVAAGTRNYVDENPNYVTPNPERYARLFGIHYQSLEPV